MILYFDTYITDIPLIKKYSYRHDNILKFKSNYEKFKKIDIAKYSLSSYKVVPWSHILIRYELEKKFDKKSFNTYLKSLFPKAVIMHQRSDSQKDYQKSLEILDTWKDNWIFYSPNNDHPIISPDKNIAKYIKELIHLAEVYEKKYDYVSIMYSHFSEFMNIPIKGNPGHVVNGRRTKLLKDTPSARIYLAYDGDFTSLQIVNKKLFRKWFDSVNLGNKRIIRAEETQQDVVVKNQIVIVPKKEICAHFDGYLHMQGQPNEIKAEQVPPLFIPSGFFENKIKIAYGYSVARKGWVNINPCAKKYTFDDPIHGTDLKITVDQIPYFWKKRIIEVDKNPDFSEEDAKKCYIRQEEIKLHPWKISSQGYTMKTLQFWVRYWTFVANVKIRTELGKFKRRFSI